jgi:hypothetical protein
MEFPHALISVHNRKQLLQFSPCYPQPYFVSLFLHNFFVIGKENVGDSG